MLARLHRRRYVHRPASFPDDPDRRSHGAHRDAHVHVVRVGSETHTAMLLFRDHLRAEPRAAARHQRTRLALLVESCRGRRYDYVNRKIPVVDVLMDDARAWAALVGPRLGTTT